MRKVADVEAGPVQPDRSTARPVPPRSALEASLETRRSRRPRVLLPLALFAPFLGVVPRPVAESKRPRVVVVLIDGLDASRMGPELMPTVWSLAHGHGGSATFYPHGRAVMPTVTNTNHASILTGTHPAAHGIVGNEIPNRDGGEPI